MDRGAAGHREAKHSAQGHTARRAELAEGLEGLSWGSGTSGQARPGPGCALPLSQVRLRPCSPFPTPEPLVTAAPVAAKGMGGGTSKERAPANEAGTGSQGTFWAAGRGRSTGPAFSAPPVAPRPRHELFGAGRHRQPPLWRAGIFTSLGKEDPAKINRYQAVSPGNKPASHWLRVMSLPVNNNLQMQSFPPVRVPSWGATAPAGRGQQPG